MAREQDTHPVDPTTPKQHYLTDSWRAGCRETGTSGSAERHGETTWRKPGTAPRVDSNDEPGWRYEMDDYGTLTIETPNGRTYTSEPEPFHEPRPKPDYLDDEEPPF